MLARKLRNVVAVSIALLAVSAAVAFATASAAGMTADEALKSLLDGNQRYVSNQMTGLKLCDLPTREGLAKSQKPYAIVLCCSDSRVPPEIIFDKGLGELFIVRVAGNVVDPIVLGSIEYAAEHIGSPLVMVLGHERCGAVTAAVDAKGTPEGNIGSVIRSITPAVQQAKKKAKGKSKPELVETAIDDNVKLVSAALTKQSRILKHLHDAGKIKIVTAKYDLDDGTVTVLK